MFVTAEEGSAAYGEGGGGGRTVMGVDLAAEEKRLVADRHAVHLGAILRDADVRGPPRQRCETWQAEGVRGGGRHPLAIAKETGGGKVREGSSSWRLFCLSPREAPCPSS